MYENSNAPLNNITLWHYLGTKYWILAMKIIVYPGVLIKETWYVVMST